MIKKTVVVLGTLVFAFGILFVSVFRTASIKYSFNSVGAVDLNESIESRNQELEEIKIDYYLPYQGSVMPGDLLWPIKATRDKLWLAVTTDPIRKAELNLLFADKRLVAAKELFDKGDFKEGYSTLTKAEKYLEKACDVETKIREEGSDTVDLSKKLILASLKHRQVIKQILLIAPDGVKEEVMVTEEYPRGVYGRKIHVLEQAGYHVPENPFSGQ
jgi:hypothetical protein